MNVIEPAVAENHNDILWPQHWNDSIYNGIGIWLVKSRPARIVDRRHNPLRFQPLIFRDLFKARHL